MDSGVYTRMGVRGLGQTVLQRSRAHSFATLLHSTCLCQNLTPQPINGVGWCILMFINNRRTLFFFAAVYTSQGHVYALCGANKTKPIFQTGLCL